MSTVLILTESVANDSLNDTSITTNSKIEMVARVIRIPLYRSISLNLRLIMVLY
jgi:hypothetical protein